MSLRRRAVSVDWESHLIRMTPIGKKSISHMLAPRGVCMSFSDDSGASGLLVREDALGMLRRLLGDPSVTSETDLPLVVGANIPFDFGVAASDEPELLPLVFQAYARGNVVDVQTRQGLIDIANGDIEFRRKGATVTKAERSLAALAQHWLGEKLDKSEDTWRMRYSELDGLPVEEYPPAAAEYAVKDSVKTLEIFEAQERYLGGEIPDELPQNRAAWALHLMSAWGARTDGLAVRALRVELEAERDKAHAILRPVGIVDESGKRNMEAIYARVEAALGERTPRTTTGKPSTDEETLISTGDPLLITLAKSMKGAKVLSTYLPALEAGTLYPICARYNVLVDTGRTSCSNPNMQNPPRAGGVRSCFVPRPGFVFGGADYDTLELRALAQVCLDVLGESELASALCAGEDPHLSLAAELLGISYPDALARYKAGESLVEEMRQLCKIADFGFPGGMAADTFVEYAAGYEINGAPVVVTHEQAVELRNGFFRRWREMRRYFDFVAACIDGGIGDVRVTQIRSGRVRGDVSFTSCANGFFQGLAADGAKWALWCVAVEAYLGICTTCRQHGDPRGALQLDLDEDYLQRSVGCADCGGSGRSVLYGSRPVIFMHDEIICEMPEHCAAEAAERLGKLMQNCMAFWIPDVPIGASPVLTRRWFKGAKPVRVGGKLVPSRMHKAPDGKKTWIHDEGKTAA